MIKIIIIKFKINYLINLIYNFLRKLFNINIFLTPISSIFLKVYNGNNIIHLFIYILKTNIYGLYTINTTNQKLITYNKTQVGYF